MFIQTEDTPNPLTIKFLPGKEVMKSGTADVRKKELSENSPLASRLHPLTNHHPPPNTQGWRRRGIEASMIRSTGIFEYLNDWRSRGRE